MGRLNVLASFLPRLASGTLPLLAVGAMLTGCGGVAQVRSGLLGGNRSSDSSIAPKTPCPGDHTGFYVCMSDSSQINDAQLNQTIKQGIDGLATLVNSDNFKAQVIAGFAGDTSITDTLALTNYVVTITGFCDPTTDVLANAQVGGASINYNECHVQHDVGGLPDLAVVTGVLLHEISHNLGYTHPDVNPSRSTVPYFLGDLTQADAGGGGTPAGLPPPTDGSTTTAPPYVFHD